MRRLATGVRLALGSARVVREVPALLVPGLVHAAAVVGAGALLVRYRDGVGAAVGLPLVVAAGVGLAVLGHLCAAVVVAATTDRMDGGDGRLGDALTVVVRRLPALLAWALLDVTVGSVLRLLQERLGPLGRLVTSAVGVAYGLATLLVVSVVVVERRSARQAVRRAAELFRRAWGESAVGDAGTGLVVLVAVLPLYLVGLAVLAAAGTVAGLVALGAVVVLHVAATTTAGAVLSAALHRWAVSGHGGHFGDLGPLFAPRPRKYVPSYAAPHGQWDAS